jgi:xanthine dehydrogenase accessory factor
VAGIIILRGGGDLASGVALRLARAGLKVVITELPQPLAVRRGASFAQAIYSGEMSIEGLTARRVENIAQVHQYMEKDILPVLVDPHVESRQSLDPMVLIDGRMTKRPPDLGMDSAPLVLGLGPGFEAGVDCHAVIETRRGADLGRVIWRGMAEADTGIPERVASWQAERVLRAPEDGILTTFAEIGDHLVTGQVIARVNGQAVRTAFDGVLRGLLFPGLPVMRGMKIGDVDPRGDPRLCWIVSDKALAIGGGALEAILSRAELRGRLWDR